MVAGKGTKFQTMRELLTQLFENAPLDPSEAARRSMRAVRRKRFYNMAAAAEQAPYGVLLDGKSVMTPARHALAVPQRALAAAIADEWNAQGEFIDPAAMPLTRLANTIIDGVAREPARVKDEIVKYLDSDLVFYRADSPEALVAQQARHWDPLLDFAREKFGARFVLAQGIVHAPQPRESVLAISAAIPADPNSAKDVWRLGALAAVTTLTGSALIALALFDGRLDAQAAWAAAQVDENFQIAAWGRDAEAAARQAARLAELEAAATVLRLAG
jgi:chaperone required for assembly of F1-ATPase